MYSAIPNHFIHYKLLEVQFITHTTLTYNVCTNGFIHGSALILYITLILILILTLTLRPHKKTKNKKKKKKPVLRADGPAK